VREHTKFEAKEKEGGLALLTAYTARRRHSANDDDVFTLSGDDFFTCFETRCASYMKSIVKRNRKRKKTAIWGMREK
jgi:hypothetical protein